MKENLSEHLITDARMSLHCELTAGLHFRSRSWEYTVFIFTGSMPTINNVMNPYHPKI